MTVSRHLPPRQRGLKSRANFAEATSEESSAPRSMVYVGLQPGTQAESLCSGSDKPDIQVSVARHLSSDGAQGW